MWQWRYLCVRLFGMARPFFLQCLYPSPLPPSLLIDAVNFRSLMSLVLLHTSFLCHLIVPFHFFVLQQKSIFHPIQFYFWSWPYSSWSWQRRVDKGTLAGWGGVRRGGEREWEERKKEKEK